MLFPVDIQKFRQDLTYGRSIEKGGKGSGVYLHKHSSKFKVGDKIKGVGRINEVYHHKDGLIQYNTDSGWMAESVLESSEINNKVLSMSFDKIKDLIQKISEGDKSLIPLALKVNEFIWSEKGREKFKDKDSKIVSQLSWLRANLNSTVSPYMNN